MHCLLQVSNDIKNIIYLYCLLVLYFFLHLSRRTSDSKKATSKKVFTPPRTRQIVVSECTSTGSPPKPTSWAAPRMRLLLALILSPRRNLRVYEHVKYVVRRSRHGQGFFYGPGQASLKNQIRMPSYTTIAKKRLLV